MNVRFALYNTYWKQRAQPASADEVRMFADLDRVFELSGSSVSNGNLCHVIKIRQGDREYYVKRYRMRGKHWRKGLGRSRALTEYRNLSYFERKQIPVPLIVAWGSQRCLGLCRRGAIVTEGIPGAVDLQTLALSRPELFQDRVWVMSLLRTIAEYTRRIHADGFIHQDLKWRNILAVPEKRPKVYFIDCPSGGFRPAPWRQRLIAKELANLDRLAVQYLSRTMRLRFYLWYRNRTALKPEDKQFITRIVTFWNNRS